MIKENVRDIINSLRARRDALGYAHEKLKQDSDAYNKIIILVSLGAGMLESVKMRLNLNTAVFALAPILLNSGIAGISALMKFRSYPTRMESITQASSLLNATLQKARNHANDIEIPEDLMIDYNSSLLACETAIYPSERKSFMVQSHKNLLMILKEEKKYYDAIDNANDGLSILSISEDGVENVLDTSNHRSNPANKIIEMEKVEEEGEIDKL
tara:strand:+ start:2943 stop:3584 length:642 start_codon:yes stop_codon:yes gene_type:complete